MLSTYLPTLKWNSSNPEGSKDGSAVSEEQSLEFRTYCQPLRYSISITPLGDMATECVTLTAITISYF